MATAFASFASNVLAWGLARLAATVAVPECSFRLLNTLNAVLKLRECGAASERPIL